MDAIDYPDIFGVERYSLYIGERLVYRTDDYGQMISVVDWYSQASPTPSSYFRIFDRSKDRTVFTSTFLGELLDNGL